MHPPLEYSASLSAPSSIRHGFFGRRGGVSEGEFAALNASATVGDDAGNVQDNIHRAVMALKVGPLPLAMARQVHGIDVVTIGEGHDFESRPQADALVTNRRGVALGILTADCVPLLLADPRAGVIGAAHAGWRGAVGDIVSATFRAMETLGATPANTICAIGPSISVDSYEVGEDFSANIRENFPDAAPFIVSEGKTKPHFDVPGLVRHQLEKQGLSQIDAVGGCTLSNPELYFSHRYATLNAIRAGRQISLIARV